MDLCESPLLRLPSDVSVASDDIDADRPALAPTTRHNVPTLRGRGCVKWRRIPTEKGRKRDVLGVYEALADAPPEERVAKRRILLEGEGIDHTRIFK